MAVGRRPIGFRSASDWPSDLRQGSFIHGRISSSIIYRGLSERADRVAVPLPFGRRGGLILRPSHARLDCFYGIDGGTYRLNRAELPGCSSSFCDPTQPWQGASEAA